VIRTTIIDDERENREIISSLLYKHFPNIDVIGTADGVSTGYDLIRKHSPDLVLLDIKMEDGLAFDLLNHLGYIDFKIIFISAYEEYALKAIKFSALDYLLKPISIKELKAAIEKAEKQIIKDLQLQIVELNNNLHPVNDKRIVLRTFDQLHLIPVKKIVRCEADRSYCKFFLQNGKEIMISYPMKEYEDLLVEQGFIRLHKSHLVNLSFIESYVKSEGGSVILSDGSCIPVSERKKSLLMKLINEI